MNKNNQTYGDVLDELLNTISESSNEEIQIALKETLNCCEFKSDKSDLINKFVSYFNDCLYNAQNKHVSAEFMVEAYLEDLDSVEINNLCVKFDCSELDLDNMILGDDHTLAEVQKWFEENY